MLKRMTPLVAAVLLATPAFAMEGSPNDSQDGHAELPTAEKLIERAMRAAGGREAMESIETLGFDAKMMIENEPAGVIDCIVTPTGRGHYKGTAMGGQVTFEFGFNDSIGWARQGGSDWRLQSGKELMIVRAWVANQFMILHLDDSFENRQTLERAQFKGRDAYRVRFEDTDHEVLPDGKVLFGWFDAENGLLIGVADEDEMREGISFEDHQSVGPIKVARKVRIEIAGYMQLNISDLSLNEADTDRLDPPAKVRKMIEKAKETEDDEG